MRLYQTIADTLEAYVITNEDFLEPNELTNIQLALAYIKIEAQYEKDYETVAYNLTKTDFSLYQKLAKSTEHPVYTLVSPRLVRLSDQFLSVHNELVEEENENLGFGPTARQLRREWRKLRRKICWEIQRLK